MKNRARFSFLFFILSYGLLLICVCLPSTVAASPQSEYRQADSFYQKALVEGENHYLSGNYKEAVKSLEIAAFGLYQDKVQLQKAVAYICLSHWNLKNRQEADTYCRRLIDLLGKEDFSTLPVDARTITELGEVASALGLKREKLEAAEAPPQKEEERSPREEMKVRVRVLEEKIEADRRQAAPYLELAGLHIDKKDVKAARKTLEKMASALPLDARAPFQLGKIHYSLRDYKNAARSFERALVRLKTQEPPVVSDPETRAYLLLCGHFRKKTKEVEAGCREFLVLYPAEILDSLALTDKDRILLQTLLEKNRPDEESPPPVQGETPVPSETPPPSQEPKPPDVENEFPAGTEAQKIETAEKRIKNEPQNAGLYYGLYDLHFQQNDLPEARKTLEKLLKNHPGESYAEFLLAEVLYRERNYREAGLHYDKYLQNADSRPATAVLRAKAAARRILCARNLGDRSGMDRLLQREAGVIREVGVGNLNLWESEKKAVQDLLDLSEKPAAASPSGTVIEDISVRKEPRILEVDILISPTSTYRTYFLSARKALVIEIFGVTEIRSEKTVNVDDFGIRAIRTESTPSGSARVLLEVVEQMPHYNIKRMNSGIRITIQKET